MPGAGEPGRAAVSSKKTGCGVGKRCPTLPRAVIITAASAMIEGQLGRTHVSKVRHAESVTGGPRVSYKRGGLATYLA